MTFARHELPLFAATVWAQSRRNDRSLAATVPVGGFYA
jgi:hypothetical protein